MIGNDLSLTCHLCSSGKVKVVFTLRHENHNYTVIACRKCDVLQTVEHYDSVSPDYVNLQDETIDADRLWCQGEHKMAAFHQWEAQVKRLIGSGDRNLSLLDIGCGTGGFLRFAQARGFSVYGFDASSAQAHYAQRELPNVRQAAAISDYLTSLDRTGMQFDIVTLWDVLEHLRDPLEFLGTVRDGMKSNGLLYVSVPNGKAMLWKRRIYSLLRQPSEHDWLPWEHVYYFSIRSLKNYLLKLGFEVLQAGAVVCYPRPISLFELVRRWGFRALSLVPSQAPQIYLWARKLT